MTTMMLLVALVVGRALFFDFTNGFHDSANAMATSVATGALKPKVVLLIAAILNVAGAFCSRTAIAATVGARTQLYFLVALTVVLVTLLAAGPLLAVFPRPALGALVTYAAASLIDVRELRRVASFRKARASSSSPC